MLQVTIHDDHSVPRGDLQARENAGLLPKVSGELNSLHPGVRLRSLQYLLICAVPGTIADKD